MKDYDQSIELLNRSIELQNDLCSAHNLKGKIYFEKNLFEDAMSCLTKAIDLNPQNLQYYFDKYFCLRNNQRLDESTIFLDYVMEKFPNSAEAFYEKGKFKVKKLKFLLLKF